MTPPEPQRQTSFVLFRGLPLLLLVFVAVLPAEPGLEKRIPWTDSRVVGSPEPPSPYRTRLAFPNLLIEKPTVITRAPGTDHIFVATHEGKIISFEDRRDVSETELFMQLPPIGKDRNGRDVPRLIEGLEFHPDYESNRYFYVFTRLKTPNPVRSRVSRFTAVSDGPGKPLKADLSSEMILLEFPSIGHSGGSIKFGPDGYLYIGTGDGYGQNDPEATGQDISDLLASILRIDVNNTHPVRPYSIPPDNPFVDRVGARPEIYAFGFRQPWKLSFDRETGDLWVGEVGQDTWESIFQIKKGGNYGWSVKEGSQWFRPEREYGPGPILGPVVSHHHAEARSMTGGFVYRGKRLKELYGAYVYADWESGKIWALRYDGEKVTWHEELDDTSLDIAAFGETHDGELYLMTHRDGRIYELEKRPQEEMERKGPEFPRLLSQTGLFESTPEHRPNPALVAYDVNAALWSDGADKERFLAIPGDGKIEVIRHNRWLFPEGSVLVKTFSIETREGDPNSKRRLETRLMVLQSSPEGREQWAGYTYIWNDEQTDAELLGKESRTETYQISTASGTKEKTWYYPSRTDCMICHNEKAGFVLGPNTWQMNREFDDSGLSENQLTALERVGFFTDAFDKQPEDLPKLIDPADESFSIEQRARSYLHSNCAHCHMRGGGGNAEIQLLSDIPVHDMLAVGEQPQHGDMGTPGSLLITPGQPEKSTLWMRMATRDDGKMPHIGTLESDPLAVDLVRKWIEGL